MAKDAGDMIGSVIGTIAKELGESVSHDGSGNGNGHSPLSKDGALSGARGVVAGAALAAAVPVAGMAAKKVVLKKVGSPGDAAKKVAEGATDKVSGGVKEAVSDKVDEAGNAPGIVKEVGKKMIPGLGGSGGGGKGKEDASGTGKGRRMPIQQEVDVGVPLSVAYNQWTQFEEWPQFMHRIDQASQEDDGSVSFRAKIWGMSKQFVAEIVEQRPDERIQWKVKEGIAHTGVVSFHELAPKLTRVQVSLDLEPGSLLEKAARGMRHVKRAVRGDLHRFKAFVEMQEDETGAWRGEIHDGEVAKKGGGKSSKSSSGKSSSRSSSSGGRSRAKKRSGSGSRKRGSSAKSKSGSGKSKSGSSRS
ncbi:MAG: SRPBCC family protein [Solirubrobacterales bacterium]